MKKTTMLVAVVACLMVAGTAMAAPVVYNLTATSPSDFGGTITIDVGNPASSSGGEDLYQYGNGVTDFSIYQSNGGVTFTPADDIWDFDVLLATADNSSIEFFCDVDGAVTGSLYGGLDFSVASQTFDTQGTVEGAALTPVPEPATMSLLAIGGIALIRRRKRA